MVDELDLQLIQALEKDGRASYVDLAESLSVGRETVKKRIQELEQSGLVKISTSPNMEALGYSFMCVVGMQVDVSQLTQISNSLAKKPNICFLACVTGRYDLLAIVISRSAEEFKDIIEKDISSTHGILRTETFINLDIIKGRLLEFETTDILNLLFGKLDTLPSRRGKKNSHNSV
jgi:Lrp/AsnC family transcriptional regulator, regulator for asnA, asnC and gidA